MRIKDILFESIPTSEAFKNWFNGSKVVDKDGLPLQVFHGTKEQFSLPFHSFTHFGTATAADHRLFGKYGYNGKIADDDTLLTFYPTMRVYPVFLCIKKPYIFTDFASNGYSDILRKMVKDNIASLEEIEALRATKSKGWLNGNFLHKECGNFIMDRLKHLGYDGLKYKNKYEDTGSTSWVIFDPKQVWHEFQ